MSAILPMGQSPALQLAVSPGGVPSQFLPPKYGPTQDFVRFFDPDPQVTLQAPHDCHSPQDPSGVKKIV